MELEFLIELESEHIKKLKHIPKWPKETLQKQNIDLFCNHYGDTSLLEAPDRYGTLLSA